MKIFNRFPNLDSIFNKMILSYIIIVLFITLVLGGTFYFYFTASYNEAVENVHLKMLEQVKNTLNTKIIETVESNYMILVHEFISNTNDLFGFHDDVSGNHTKILQTYNYLKKIVSNNSTVISNIHIYYKKQKILISSSLGVKYLNETNWPYYMNQDWINEMSGKNTSHIWLETRKVPLNLERPDTSLKINLLTYVRSYPVISTGINSDGFIAIDINESIFSDLIKMSAPSEYTNTFIISGTGEIISHPEKDMLNECLNDQKYIEHILDSRMLYGSTVDEVNGVKSMISYTSFPDTGWILINITPLSQFYEKTASLTRMLVILCLMSIIIGTVIASLITKNLYNPLKLLLDKIRSLIGNVNAGNKRSRQLVINTGIQHKANEFKIIDNAIDNLYLTIDDLTKTLKNNIPIIKYNLIMGLLHNQIINVNEAREKFRLINIDMDFPYYAAMTIEIESLRDISYLSVENMHFLKYNLIDETEKNSNDSLKFIAVDLPDFRIGVIVGATTTDEKEIGKIVSNLSSYAYNSFYVTITAALGRWVDNILNVHNSFNDTKTLLKYRFFYPHVPLLHADTLERENCQEHIPPGLIMKFQESLKLQNINRIKELMDKFRSLCSKGGYSADHLNQVMFEFVNIVSRYIRDMKYQFKDIEKKDIYAVFKNINNVNEFCDWIVELARSVINGLNERAESQNAILINKAKRYIYNNIKKDISLDEVAEHINISPAYLSKLFKENTGVNFVTYVKELKFELAMDLLLNSDLTIQQIAHEVGFNTPAYFIQQFKARYGYTPNSFRKQKSFLETEQ
ncbi:transcriptional regulator [Thermoclostridium stercorarium subsp. stercorarium DSM 8532]|nr:helix-turn-helix domain-containing protein [Thermoclostridium stercorarium]AGI39066.2 transcriptional regulator [Thermoclostridium stercorarium subsp. stercorarium DSM 8532]